MDVVNIERVDARWEAATEKSHRPRGMTVEIDETGRIAIVELSGDPHLAGDRVRSAKTSSMMMMMWILMRRRRQLGDLAANSLIRAIKQVALLCKALLFDLSSP